MDHDCCFTLCHGPSTTEENGDTTEVRIDAEENKQKRFFHKMITLLYTLHYSTSEFRALNATVVILRTRFSVLFRKMFRVVCSVETGGFMLGYRSALLKCAHIALR